MTIAALPVSRRVVILGALAGAACGPSAASSAAGVEIKRRARVPVDCCLITARLGDRDYTSSSRSSASSRPNGLPIHISELDIATARERMDLRSETRKLAIQADLARPPISIMRSGRDPGAAILSTSVRMLANLRRLKRFPSTFIVPRGATDNRATDSRLQTWTRTDRGVGEGRAVNKAADAAPGRVSQLVPGHARRPGQSRRS